MLCYSCIGTVREYFGIYSDPPFGPHYSAGVDDDSNIQGLEASAQRINVWAQLFGVEGLV